MISQKVLSRLVDICGDGERKTCRDRGCDFHYHYVRKKYNDNNDKAKLLFTDTDSLTYEIETNNGYNDFWSDKDKFDISEYPESSPYFDK